MEKIYMEDNTTRSRSKKLTGSVVLSFVVALFAIFSLAVCGITQVTYAIDPTTGDFEFYATGNDDLYVSAISSNDASHRLDISMLFSDSQKSDPIFCIERNIGIPDNGTVYTAEDEANNIENDDFGLGILYILNNSFASPNSSVKANFLSGADDEVKYWATQAAIWLYLDETHVNSADYDNHRLSDAHKDVILHPTGFAKTTDMDSYNVGSNDVGTVIRNLVNSAKAFNQEAILNVSNINPSLTISDNKEFYQSEEVQVSSSQNNLINYSVSLSGLDGAYIVDANGNTIENNSAIAAANSFWIRVPKDKVTTSVQRIKVDVTGNFEMATGTYYRTKDIDKQTVVSVGKTNTSRNTSFNVEVVGAPDTAMSTAQTIYFIGLVILLCGVGIVYANAKPSEIKQ